MDRVILRVVLIWLSVCQLCGSDKKSAKSGQEDK